MKNKLNELWEKYQIFIWPIIGGVVSIALLVFVIIPQIFKVTETNKKIADTRQKITLLNKKASDLKQINLTEYKADFVKLNIVLPTQLDVPSAISQIQNLAASSNTQITGFNVVPPAADTEADGYSIKLSFKGSSASTRSFIDQLKNAPRLMTLTTIDMTGDKVGTSFDVALDLQTYYQKQKTTLSGIEDSITLLSENDKAALAKIDQSVKTTPIVSEDTISGPKGKLNPFE